MKGLPHLRQPFLCVMLWVNILLSENTGYNFHRLFILQAFQ